MPRNFRMLVVEDDKDMRTGLVQQFETEGFTVDTADDGIPALKKIQKNHYDIVLLDLKLPRMDGLRLLEKMKHMQRIPKVIVITAVNLLSTAEECARLGATDFISKPYDPEELLNIVMRTLSS